jgi:7-carboxy-7-deazaguanine synthase
MLMSNENSKYPISEIFTSVQGEGIYAGVAMTFIRLAGCTVGKPFPKEPNGRVLPSGATQWRILPIYTEQCTLFDGRKFPCDTDYRAKERMHPFQILQEVPKNVKHVCISGGEPLMHDLDNLLSYLADNKKYIHIETSGTISKPLASTIWVTVSPKLNPYLSMIERADEIKLLVDKDFSPDAPIMCLYEDQVQAIYPIKLAEYKPVYLQPVNFENEVHKDNLKLCLMYQNEYPDFRVSPQMHKLFTQQTGELVR